MICAGDFDRKPQQSSARQAAYDAWHAEREVDVSKIPTLEQA
jgi:hypothetical protein